MFEIALIFAVLGLVAGMAAGLLGIGGGVIVVPVLIFLAPMLEIDPAIKVHLAIGTSLATIMVTGVSSAWTHHRHGAVRWGIVWQMAVGIVMGTALGAVTAAWLPGEILKRVFGGLLLLLAVQMVSNWQPKGGGELPKSGILIPTAGVGVGIMASLTGIGGGLLVVPLLRYWGMAIRQAVATSAGCGIPVAVSGTLGFIVTGWQVDNLPPWSLGFIYLPAFLGIATMSVLAAPFGAKLTHILPTKLIRQIFAFVMTLVGIDLILF